MGLRLSAIDRRAAHAFVNAHHRHHQAPVGEVVRLAAFQEGRLCGVALLGRPVARALDDGSCWELTRLCTDGTKNVATFLLAASRRAARSRGIARLVTYTLAAESGHTLKLDGWRPVARVRGRSWSCPSRPRRTRVLGDKVRWEAP
jgi:hypothetical protein